MTSIEIAECKDIEVLRKLCLEQRKQLTTVGEICVEESKMHCNAPYAIHKIREYLIEHQYDLEINL